MLLFVAEHVLGTSQVEWQPYARAVEPTRHHFYPYKPRAPYGWVVLVFILGF